MMPAEILKGIYKLQEEMNELGTVLSKFGPFPLGDHPSPEYTAHYTLHDHMCEEMADVKAALKYFEETNRLPVSAERYMEKLNKFRHWGMTGLVVPEHLGSRP